MNENQTSNVQKGLGKDALSVSDGTTAAATTSASADVKASNQTDQTQNQHLFHSYYQVKREPSHRVFVNRSLQLSKIKYFGFDMDYTLALYKSPQYEILAFNLVIEQLLKLGYPSEIKTFKYDPSFPVRGLWYDKLYGNLLKMDAYGNILVCVHGFKFLKTNEIYKLYPNKYLNFDESRVYALNTLFSLPEIYLLACLINYFTTSPSYKSQDNGVSSGEIFMSFKAIFQDVREAIDYVHIHGDLKQITVDNLKEYVVKDNENEQRLSILLNRMHENKAKVFLLTNSGYDYTDKIMSYLLNDSGRHWRSYFDYIVVDARKPLFFEEGTSLKEIDIATGIKNFGSHAGPLRANQVYSGGSCDVFSKLIGCRGKDVLYVGDHIFGDIIKSKKERAWRTFLIIPELSQEMLIWHEKRDIFTQIEQLDKVLSQKLIDLDSSSKLCPNISNIKHEIQKCIHEMDMQYGLLGSLFRTGARQTHFASQVTRYADIYAASHLNLLHYPFFYLFKAPPMLMPHESTVHRDTPYEHIGSDYGMMIKARSKSLIGSESDNAQAASAVLATNSETKPSTTPIDIHIIAPGASFSSSSVVAAPSSSVSSSIGSTTFINKDELHHAMNMPETPSQLTHHADFDDDDEDSDESKISEASNTPPK